MEPVKFGWRNPPQECDFCKEQYAVFKEQGLWGKWIYYCENHWKTHTTYKERFSEGW